VDDVIKVGLVDDEPLFTAGLAMIVDSQPDLSTVWQANDGEQAWLAQRRDPAKVLLVDIQMPVLDGLAFTRQLVAAKDSARVVIVTTFDTDVNVLAAIEAGASGFLVKNSAPEALLAAIRTVAAGDAVISPGPTRRLLDRLRPSAKSSARTGDAVMPPISGPDQRAVADLTKQERRLLRLVAQGLTNSEICDELWLSMSTVKTHISHLLAKTASRDRVQLVLFGLRTGEVSLAQLLTRHPSA
jgi:DNA-binding NarL/FixJ family response regulator